MRKIDSTIEDRNQKGIGIVNQIWSVLSSISLGFYDLNFDNFPGITPRYPPKYIALWRGEMES